MSPTARSPLRFDFVVPLEASLETHEGRPNVRLEIVRDALQHDQRWTSVEVEPLRTDEAYEPRVIVSITPAANDPVEELRLDVVKVVRAVLPDARLLAVDVSDE